MPEPIQFTEVKSYGRTLLVSIVQHPEIDLRAPKKGFWSVNVDRRTVLSDLTLDEAKNAAQYIIVGTPDPFQKYRDGLPSTDGLDKDLFTKIPWVRLNITGDSVRTDGHAIILGVNPLGLDPLNDKKFKQDHIRRLWNFGKKSHPVRVVGVSRYRGEWLSWFSDGKSPVNKIYLDAVYYQHPQAQWLPAITLYRWEKDVISANLDGNRIAVILPLKVPKIPEGIQKLL